jgi:hypothetical protein
MNTYPAWQSNLDVCPDCSRSSCVCCDGPPSDVAHILTGRVARSHLGTTLTVKVWHHMTRRFLQADSHYRLAGLPDGYEVGECVSVRGPIVDDVLQVQNHCRL